MNNVIDSSAVLTYFKQLCEIPHRSHNEKALSDYLARFADKHGLEYIQDNSFNIIIRKPGTSNVAEPIILQAHIDMVCEKNIGTVHDFEADPLQLNIKDGFITAANTTLGADNGVGVAMIMAVLAATDIKHPPIEALFTTKEEVGMIGAIELDTSQLKSKRLINLDTEEEGSFCTSCAGGLKVKLSIPITRESIADKVSVQLSVKGLRGGHSGMDIGLQRGNSIILIARVIDELKHKFDIGVIDIFGGAKDNAIPRESFAHLAVRDNDLQDIKNCVKLIENIFRDELNNSDPLIDVTLSNTDELFKEVFSSSVTDKFIAALLIIPDGVQSKDLVIAGLPESSNNIGVVHTLNDELVIICAVRSSRLSKRDVIENRIKYISKFLGARLDVTNVYPAWSYNKDSELREILTGLYFDMYKKKAVITGTHGGLECGVFCDKMKGLDVISFGPDIYNAHTPDEKADINSINRVWEFLIKALERL